MYSLASYPCPYPGIVFRPVGLLLPVYLHMRLFPLSGLSFGFLLTDEFLMGQVRLRSSRKPGFTPSSLTMLYIFIWTYCFHFTKLSKEALCATVASVPGRQLVFIPSVSITRRLLVLGMDKVLGTRSWKFLVFVPEESVNGLTCSFLIYLLPSVWQGCTVCHCCLTVSLTTLIVQDKDRTGGPCSTEESLVVEKTECRQANNTDMEIIVGYDYEGKLAKVTENRKIFDSI